MNHLEDLPKSKQNRALTLSTLSFAVCFAVWTIFSIIGIQLQEDLGLNETQFGLLIGTPILTGSLTRIFLGIWADQYGGRIVFFTVMILAAMATFLLSQTETYLMALLAALGLGLAGGSFIVGIAYVSKWYPAGKQGTALGIFGTGNAGAGVTMFAAPVVLVAFGWQAVAQAWAAALVVMAIIFWLMTEDDPEFKKRQESGAKHKGFIEQLEPLKNIQVWRFSIYYFFVFGGFVALSLWLPRYLIGVYDVNIQTAGILAAIFAIPASLFRAYGGHLSDKYGARTMMYVTFSMSILCTFILSYPKTEYIVHGIEGPISFSASTGLVPFVSLTFVFGSFMSMGMAAVFKHIPAYYPEHVGAVGGLVGMIGGLGGFVMPLSFGVMNDITGIWTSCFMLMFVIVTVLMLWMHHAIRKMETDALREQLAELPDFPEMLEFDKPEGT